MLWNADEFAHRLRVLRIDRRLSREELAAKAGLNKSTIDSWEAGRNCPQLDKALEVADVLGVTLNELVGTNVGEKVA